MVTPQVKRQNVKGEITKGLWKEAMNMTPEVWSQITTGLNGFNSVDDLINFIASTDEGNRPLKNQVLYYLIQQYHKSDKSSQAVVISVLLLGLWKKMEQITRKYYQCLKRVGEPFAEVYYAYITALLGPQWNEEDNIMAKIEVFVRESIRKEVEEARRFILLHSDMLISNPVQRLRNSYPPPWQLQEKYQWNYQGIKLLDEAVQDKVLRQIEAEIITEVICYERSFSQVAEEQGLKIEVVIKHYENALNKLKRNKDEN